MFGMKAIATTKGKKVLSVTVNSGGSFNGTPTLGFTGGGGSGAAANAVMGTTTGPGPISGIIYAQTSGYYASTSAIPTITLSGGVGGGGFVIASGWAWSEVAYVGGAVEVSSNSATITLSPGSGASATASSQSGLNPAQVSLGSISVANGGSGYTSAPTVVFTPASNYASITTGYVAPTATATVSGGQVTGITLTSGGSWKSNSNNSFFGIFGSGVSGNVTFSGGGGSGATISVNSYSPSTWWAGNAGDGLGNTYSVNLTNRGRYGYGFTAPTVTVSGTISGSLTAVLGMGLSDSTSPTYFYNGGNPGVFNSGGGSYSSPPTATFSGGTPLAGYTPSHSISVVISTTTDYYLSSVNITNQGNGYTTAPTLTYSGVTVNSTPSTTVNIG